MFADLLRQMGGGFGDSGGGTTPGGFNVPGFDPQMLGMVFTRIGQMLSSDSGPVNWELARDLARQTLAGAADPSVTDGERRALRDAVRLAELWLDDVTTLPAGTTDTLAWSRAEWIEETLPVWKRLVEPVAARMAGALGGILPSDAEAGPFGAMIGQIGGAIFGTQLGQGLATLATEVLSSSDVGLPLGPAGKAAMLPANITAFSVDLEVPPEEIRLYLALREAAYHRLFAHVPWLRARLLGAVEAYAQGIQVDQDRLTELASGMEGFDPEALQNLMAGGGMFGVEDTPEQQAALARLETLLALAEGWVDAVVNAAAEGHLPHASALRETLRRRRAVGGPAEQTFSALVGLELRPRRLRDAARLWSSLTDARRISGRDAIWAHPDLLPTSKDLDDPDGFVYRDEIDLGELDDLMKQDPEQDPGEGESDT
jgi:putative hydrolase